MTPQRHQSHLFLAFSFICFIGEKEHQQAIEGSIVALVGHSNIGFKAVEEG